MPIEIHRKKLKCLGPALKRWVRLNNQLAEKWHQDGDVPWWYNERTLTGVLAGAIWLKKGVCLEEYFVSKRNVTKSHRIKRGEYTGRADLFFQVGRNSFRAEAKQDWIPSTQKKNQKERLAARWVKVHRAELRQANPKDGRRLAIMFFTPYVYEKKREHLKDRIKWSLDQVKSLKWDACAWTFPHPGKYGEWKGKIFPGIIVLIKERTR